MMQKIYQLLAPKIRLSLLFLFFVPLYSQGQVLSRKDSDEIRILAREKVKALNDLLNAIANEDLSNYERNYLITNSFMPGNDQLFFNDGVVVESDIDPKHTSSAPGLDLSIEKYLNNFDLFYSKAEKNSIEFSSVVVSDVKVNGYPFVKVFFTSTYTGTYKTTNEVYKPVTRVAEMRANRLGNEWFLFITRVAFHTPGLIQSVPSDPKASASYELASKQSQKATSQATYMDENAKAGDRIANDLQKRTSFQSRLSANRGIIKLSVGIAALAFGAVTYGMLNKDFKDYKNRIDNPEGFMQYAKPGIYISMGFAAAGLGISLSSLIDFKK